MTPTQTILVVDDMALVREPLAGALANAGYRTFTADTGEAALARMFGGSETKIDLILLDLTMPGIGGIGTLEALRATTHGQNLPVILLTASSDRDSIVKTAKLGVRDYLLKSKFSIDELLERVRKYLPPPSATTGPGAGDDPAAHAAGASASAPPPPEPPALADVVETLLSLTTADDSTIEQVIECAKQNADVCAKLTEAARVNALASSRRKVSTVEDAVRYLGFKEVRKVVETLAPPEQTITPGTATTV